MSGYRPPNISHVLRCLQPLTRRRLDCDFLSSFRNFRSVCCTGNTCARIRPPSSCLVNHAEAMQWGMQWSSTWTVGKQATQTGGSPTGLNAQAIATRCRTQAAIARALPAAQKSSKRHVAHGRSEAGFGWCARRLRRDHRKRSLCSHFSLRSWR
jgi:hypothetical protein